MNYNPLFDNILSKDPQFSDRYCFKNGAQAVSCTIEDKLEKLWRFFGDSDNVNAFFMEAYKKCATPLERRRIHQLNSSALLPLLCFWNINEDNSIKILGRDYTRVFFEIKNKVFESPSNVDVLLVNKAKDEFLFLESKFTEPLDSRPYLDIKAPYLSIYNDLKELLNVEVSEVREEVEKGKNIKVFSIFSAENHYWGGIKQMVSHLIGLLQGPAKPNELNYIESNCKFRLGTILYDFANCGIGEYEHQYNDYVRLYKRIFAPDNIEKIITSIEVHDKLNIRLKRENLEVLPEPLTYQNIFKEVMNAGISTPKTRLFYNL